MKTRVEGILYGEAEWLEWEDGIVSGSDLALADLHDLRPPVLSSQRYQGIEKGEIDLRQQKVFAVCAQAVLGQDIEFLGDVPKTIPIETVG